MAKVMVSIPDDLLEQIDRAARSRGVSRSALLQGAARRDLEAGRGEEIRAALTDGRALVQGLDLPPLDSTALIRADRDTRDDRRLYGTP